MFRTLFARGGKLEVTQYSIHNESCKTHLLPAFRPQVVIAVPVSTITIILGRRASGVPGRALHCAMNGRNTLLQASREEYLGNAKAP